MDENIREVVAKASEGYAANTILRASVQGIPYVGGPLDTLLAGRGAKIQSERLCHFLSELSHRLERVEAVPEIDEQALFDLSINAMEKSVRTRLAEKRTLYANVIARHVAQSCPVDESEMVLRIIAELEPVHIEILREAIRAPICDEPFKDLRVITLKEYSLTNSGGQGPVILSERLSDCPVEVIRYAASELVARGLLVDEGVGRMDIRAMEYLVPTDTAYWLSEWLSEPSDT